MALEQDFLDTISRAGIPPTHSLVFDGKLRRYRVNGDRKGRKNGWYRFVRVSSDYAWGVFGCNKRGISDRWSSKAASQITTYEKKQRKVLERQIAEDTEALQGKAAIKASRMWSWLQWAGEHPYTRNKGVGCYGVKILNSSLVVPIYEGMAIVSLQFITPEGNKRFLAGGKKEGGYYWIGADSDVIFVAEGYSTAASIYEATGKQVIIAFDAGNIPPVVNYVRLRNPEKKIIIACDNDQWTQGNPGLSKAQEAAGDNDNVQIKIPPFSFEDAARPTDFNDYHARFGLEALRKVLMDEAPKINTALTPAEDSWKMQLLSGKNFLPGYKEFDGKCRTNAYLFLENHPDFKDMVSYNVFSDQIMIMRCPPWEDKSVFFPRRLEETDGFAGAKELEKYEIRVKNEDVYNSLRIIGRKRQINPPRDYFDRLVWDGKHRLDNWLTYYLGAERQPQEYLSLIGAKWLMGGVARVYKPGAKFDNVLILEGPQGRKKSMAFEVLATFTNEIYYLEFMGDVSKKDSLITMQGKIIVEMSELASVRKSLVEEMKSFISRRVDEYRPVYGRNNIKRPRFFIFGGTTNKIDQEYLEDETGARRIWPVTCGEIDIDALRRDSEQLWAEAIARYKAGERIWLEGDEIHLAKMEQDNRQHWDVWEEAISEYLYGISEITTNALMEKMNLATRDRTNFAKERIKKCLKNLGWTEIRTLTEGNGRIRTWKRKSSI